MIVTAVNSYSDRIEDALSQNAWLLIEELEESGEAIDSATNGSRIVGMMLEYGYDIKIYQSDGEMVYPKGTDTLEPSLKTYLRTSEYINIGYYGDSATRQFCYAVKFSCGEEAYYLYLLSDASEVVEYTVRLSLQLLLVLVLSMVAAWAAFTLAVRRINHDFAHISEVASRYAEGDFSARAEVQETGDLYPFACTLNRMAEVIDQNETTRQNFIANVSHELRTPMTTIGGFAEGILDGTIPPEEQKKYLRIISDEIKRLRTLVNSMLNLSKFEAGEMQIHPISMDASKLLIKTVLMFEKRITDKNVDVIGLGEDSLTLRADEDLLFQVLYNLVENAVKFVSEEGEIAFSLYEQDKIAHICIKNTGAGLGASELPRLFDRFYKTDPSRSEDRTGLGLGLSIARKIVHLHGGHIVVKSVEGEYTLFDVQLPI